MFYLCNAKVLVENSSGNVGIGTTNPGYKLDVQGGDVRVGAPTINWASGNPDVFVQGNLEIDATAYMDGPLVIGTSGMETTGNINTRKTTGYNYFMSSVGIGNSSPGQKLDITAGNGRVDSGYSWLTNSDIRFKKNITTLKDSLKKVLAIRGVRYDLIGAEEIKEGEGKHIGFVAQELKEEFPELVVTDAKGDNSVDYDKMTAVLVEAIKEQHRQIADLRSEISQLNVQSKVR